MLDATPLLRLYARYRLRRLAGQRSAETQERQLLGLLNRAADTRFGREHGFAGIGSVAEFQRRVPLRRYEDFWSDYWEAAFPELIDVSWPGRLPYFAVTSGTTTGVTKYIPCSRAMLGSNRKAAADLLCWHLHARPGSRIMAGRNFMLGGSTGLTVRAPGVESGDLSGILAKEMPWWARRRSFPPAEYEAIADWEEKIARLASLSLETDIRSISGTPSWLLLFFERLAALRPEAGRRLGRLYPNLELVVHGGIHFAPYRPLFAEWLAESGAETREVYAASEGFVAVADRGDGEGLRMVLDNGLFYEFVPLAELDSPQPTRHWLATAETGVNYALVLSSCAGLFAYVLGDTVELVETDPPRLLVTGRTSYTLSAFGEHLIDAEIEDSVAEAAAGIEAAVTDFAVGPIFPETAEARGGHLFLVEFAQEVAEPERIARFARALDAALAETNEDYAAHRAGDFGMAPPRVHAVAPGGFAAWMARRGRLGGQNKVPRIVNDPELFADLRRYFSAP